jgi:hypothetical protein
MINKINSIYRIRIKYKLLHESGIKIFSYFIFPSKPNEMIKQITKLFRKKEIVKSEMGILLSHGHINMVEKSVLAIGLGPGISLIYNCNILDCSKFYAIEASNESILYANANIALNNVNKSKYEIIHAYIGSLKGVYGNSGNASNLRATLSDYKFDILELDCEGCEFDILTNIDVNPEFIIVETHPHIREINFRRFIDAMKKKGYQIIRAYTENGKEILIGEIEFYFLPSTVKKIKEGALEYGSSLLVLTFRLYSSSVSKLSKLNV